MTPERERDFFVSLLRPVLLKVVAWINRNYGCCGKCGSCGQQTVKF